MKERSLERRNVAARRARDRLAAMLGVHSRELGGLSLDVVLRISAHMSALHRRVQTLVDAAAVDEMTSVLRRGAGFEALEREVQRARRFGDTGLVVVFLDVDGLKKLNDNMGHEEGDRAITAVATMLRDRLRAYDLVIRWGGDEFVCVLPEAGIPVAERIVTEITTEFHILTGVSVSAGFAECGADESPSAAIARADLDLYRRRRERDAVDPALRQTPPVLKAIPPRLSGP